MKGLFFAISLFAVLSISVTAQTILAPGDQPQLTVDAKGKIRLVYGENDNIYFSTSSDNGKTFSLPQLVAQVNEMHLGMTRGPQLATSGDYSLITAMDKKGNIHAFKQSHKTGKWERIANVNSVDGSAPEGLMSIAADESNNFYAVWLDLRKDKMNNICFASLKNSKWSTNKFVYKSPDEHVCECCKPSITVKGKTVAIMFRNWLRGSRDLYFITSKDGGQNFSDAQKLGNGTWPLKKDVQWMVADLPSTQKIRFKRLGSVMELSSTQYPDNRNKKLAKADTLDLMDRLLLGKLAAT